MRVWQSLSYRLVRGLVRLAMRLLTRTRIEGLEHLPRRGAGVVVCNHIHAIDPAFLVGGLPRRITMIAKEESRRGPLRIFWPMAGVITIRRGAGDRQAIEQAEHALAQGLLVGLFPEGTRSRDGRLQRGQGGAALLAAQAGVPIIPAAITGTRGVFHHGFPWVTLPRARVTLRLGPPFYVAVVPGESRHAARRRQADEIMRQIAALLPPEMRGPYGEPAGGLGWPPDVAARETRTVT